MVRSRDNEAQLDELGDDPGQVGPDSGGQSGDTQGLSEIADAADESVEELADTGQATRLRSLRAWRMRLTIPRNLYTPVRIRLDHQISRQIAVRNNFLRDWKVPTAGYSTHTTKSTPSHRFASGQ